LASPANLGGALQPRFPTLSNPAAGTAEFCQTRFRSRLARFFLLSVFLAFSPSILAASGVSLAWNANPENNITGYRVSYGTSSGVFPNVVNVGTNPIAYISGLYEGTTYYFVVAAVNQAGLQGEASDETSYLVPPTVVIPENNWALKYADSQESLDYRAEYAFDSDPTTIWHTAWSGNTTPPPHEIQINLGSSQAINGFGYVPRLGSLLVGNVGQFEFYVSEDGANWGNPVSTGTFPNTGAVKEVKFPTKTGKFIKFRGLSDANGGTYMSVAELYLIQDDTSPSNQAPVATPKSVTILQNSSVAIQLSGTDLDGNSLTYSIGSYPTHGTLSGTPPSVTYSPTSGFSGNDSFTFFANDGTLNSAAATVSIAVNAVNHAPVATSKSVNVNEDTPIAIVLAGTDPDGDSLTFNVVNGPDHGSLSGTAPNLTYSPSSNFSGSDRFTFSANDGSLTSAVATVSITVADINDAPVAISQSLTTMEDATVSFTLTGTDVESNPLTFSTVSGPSNGTVTGTPPNLVYQPTAGFSGNDQFTFKVNDGSLNSTPATISITVNPKLTDSSLSVLSRSGWSLKYVDSQEVFDAAAILAFDGDPGTFWRTQWRSGSVPALPHEIQINLGSVQSIAGFQYLPRQDNPTVGTVQKYEFYVSLDGSNWGSPVAKGIFSNSKSEKVVTFSSKSGKFIRFRALSEVNGTSDTCVAELNVLKGNNVNRAPVANSQFVGTDKDTPIDIVITGSDADGASPTFSIAGTPSHGTLSGTAPNLTYVPKSNYTGSDQFTFRVNDGAVDSTTAKVTITVTPVTDVPGNVAPVFGNSSIPSETNEDSAYSGLLNATDANGDVLIFSKISGPAWLAVSQNGTLSGTPQNSNVGPNVFSVKVRDPFKASANTTFTITVANTNDAPAFKLSPVVYPAGTEKVAYRDQSLANIAYDPDRGDSLAFTKISGPEWLTVSISGTLEGTPPKGSAGDNEFTIRATDLSGAATAAMLQIKINSNNLPLPWKLERVGKGNLDGPACYSAGVFTMGGAGALAKSSDAGNFGWQKLSGSGDIVARIKNLDNTGSKTRVGLMIRESLAANSRQIFVGVDGKGQLRWMNRTSNGGKAKVKSRKGSNGNSPWLKLVRRGHKILSYTSTYGVEWTEVGSITLKLPKNCYIGLSVSSGDKDELNTSKFSNVKVRP
jgi:hypothetical protein